MSLRISRARDALAKAVEAIQQRQGLSEVEVFSALLTELNDRARLLPGDFLHAADNVAREARAAELIEETYRD